MARLYPALDLSWPAPPSDQLIDEVIARVDEFSPTAVETRPLGIRVFFATAANRQQAAAHLNGVDERMTCALIDVSDEDWAARSQAALGPIRVGRIVVTPPHTIGALADTDTIEIVIEASMGFGTGHHASTRLCLRLLQQLPLTGWRVLDVGTGSGVLAIAASKLGAAHVDAIDMDPDAIEAAHDSVARNLVSNVNLSVDTSGTSNTDGCYDLVLANLTGATLVRLAETLSGYLTTAGYLIASGFQPAEETEVTAALLNAGLTFSRRESEEDWLAMVFDAPRT